MAVHRNSGSGHGLVACQRQAGGNRTEQYRATGPRQGSSPHKHRCKLWQMGACHRIRHLNLAATGCKTGSAVPPSRQTERQSLDAVTTNVNWRPLTAPISTGTMRSPTDIGDRWTTRIGESPETSAQNLWLNELAACGPRRRSQAQTRRFYGFLPVLLARTPLAAGLHIPGHLGEAEGTYPRLPCIDSAPS